MVQHDKRSTLFIEHTSHRADRSIQRFRLCCSYGGVRSVPSHMPLHNMNSSMTLCVGEQVLVVANPAQHQCAHPQGRMHLPFPQRTSPVSPASTTTARSARYSSTMGCADIPSHTCVSQTKCTYLSTLFPGINLESILAVALCEF